jgi:hypothetical protein
MGEWEQVETYTGRQIGFEMTTSGVVTRSDLKHCSTLSLQLLNLGLFNMTETDFIMTKLVGCFM